MDFWGLTVAAAIASAAWIYQRAWEHQEKRIGRYNEILNRLPAFTVSGRNTEVIDEALAEERRLWLSAPDDVVLAYERLLDLAEGRHTDPDCLGLCIQAMRRDASFSAAVFPRFWRTKLGPEHFRLRSASKQVQ